MKKKILVLTGSPRKAGNSTLLAWAFIAGAEEAGHEVSLFETAKKNIDDCKACKACFSRGGACVFNDDFNELAPMLEWSQVLVLATPLYWFSFPTCLKAAIDKMRAFIMKRRPMDIRECALLACAGERDIKCFDGLVSSYSLILDFQNWRDRGRILVPNMNTKGDVRKTGDLDKAKRLGKSI